jgi:hypothetical protein
MVTAVKSNINFLALGPWEISRGMQGWDEHRWKALGLSENGVAAVW